MSKLRAGSIAAAVLALTGAAQALEIRSHTIDSGGGSSNGPRFRVSGTIGQPDAHASIGPRFSLDGGFWPAPETTILVDPIFSDGFE